MKKYFIAFSDDVYPHYLVVDGTELYHVVEYPGDGALLLATMDASVALRPELFEEMYPDTNETDAELVRLVEKVKRTQNA